MKLRLPPWAMLLVLVVVCAGIVVGVAAYRMHSAAPQELIRRLPSDGAVIVSIDFAALRRAGVLGILSGSHIVQDPEYRGFVDQTGFDYLTDLDRAMVSFHRSGTYFLLRGRFDWKALGEYVAHQGGSCVNTFCGMAGSTQEHYISFYPLRPDTMALAVSPDAYAAQEIQRVRPPAGIDPPPDAVWSLIPVSTLQRKEGMPPAAQLLVRPLEGTISVLLAAAPEGNRIAVRLDATCTTVAHASALATQLRDITAHLRDAAPRPDPGDLSGILAAGVFEQKDTHVLGRWPVQREFLESLAGGAL